MGISLQDQLLKAGLVDKKQANQARKQKKKAQRQAQGRPSSTESTSALARAAASLKAERDRELNRQRSHEAERKALLAQVRQLVEGHRIPIEDGEIGYNFSHEGKIRTLHVSPDLRNRLTDGQVAIVAIAGEYALVPQDVADKIRSRDEHCVITAQGAVGPTAAEDDRYAGYEVPDDLVW
jgi:uncharacterized protein YaiL (DUF2058 family)